MEQKLRTERTELKSCQKDLAAAKANIQALKLALGDHVINHALTLVITDLLEMAVLNLSLEMHSVAREMLKLAGYLDFGSGSAMEEQLFRNHKTDANSGPGRYFKTLAGTKCRTTTLVIIFFQKKSRLYLIIQSSLGSLRVKPSVKQSREGEFS